MALTGAQVKTQVHHSEDTAIIEISLANGGNGPDVLQPYVYIAELELSGGEVSRVQIVHEGDHLTGTRGKPAIVFDEVIDL